MDTISRENNPSILPIVGVGLGVVACILAIVAIAKASPVKKLSADVESLNNQVQSVSGDISAAKSEASRASSMVNNLATKSQDAFNQVTAALETMRGDINKLAALRTAPASKGAAAKDGAGEKAGPGGDYTIKAGDTPAKIARAHGVSTDAIMAANPGLEPTKLKVGQKINLPK